MIRTKKVILALLTAIICAALAGAVLLFGANGSYARADEKNPQSTHSKWEHTTPLTDDGGELSEEKYYLEGNIDLKNNIIIPTGVTVEICLNGHTLKGTGNGSVITINGGTLILHDCNNSGSGEGKITNGNAEYGGGVYVGGSFTMKGGTIEKNTATQFGGGVYIAKSAGSSFTLEGGTITANTADGDNACVYATQNLTIAGGKIMGNGGNSRGVHVTSGAALMKGGEISGHKTGVYVQGGSFAMTGGTITGNKIGIGGEKSVTFGGSPKVINNKDGETNQNVVLVQKGTEKGNKFVQITNSTETLKDGAEIGITITRDKDNIAAIAGVITDGYSQANKDHPAKYFTSDSDKYAIILNDSNEAELVEKENAGNEITGIKAEFTKNGVIYATTKLEDFLTSILDGTNTLTVSTTSYGKTVNAVSNYTLSTHSKIDNKPIVGKDGIITVSYEYAEKGLILTTTFTINNLDEEPEPEVLGLEVNFEPNGAKFYTTDDVDRLKEYLTVKVLMSDGNDIPVVEGYELSPEGKLTAGSDVEITVTYTHDGKKLEATFTVNVIDKLEEDKKQAESDLDDYAEEKKGEIDGLDDLSPEEKDDFKKEIDKEVEDAKKEIEKSGSTSDVDKVVDDTKGEIDDIVKDAKDKAAENKDIKDKQDKAEKELEDYFEEQIKDKDLTEEEKKELEDKVKDVIDKAKGEIGKGEKYDKVIEDAEKEIDDIIAGKPKGGNESNLLWLTITLSVILLLDVAVLIAQLVSRKKKGADNAGEEEKEGEESEGGNE